jgi:hypothetical protein
MSYVLVTLVGDEATQEANSLAQWFAARRKPVAIFADSSPSHSQIRAALSEVPVALVFGHDGNGSLRATNDGPAWATPEQFASIFKNSRVYTYACNTIGSHFNENSSDSFGHRAIRSGVRVFAGHCVWATASLAGVSQVHRDAIRKALADVFDSFLDGENDGAKLRLRAEESFDIIEAGFGLNGGVPMAIHGMMQGLRVLL